MAFRVLYVTLAFLLTLSFLPRSECKHEECKEWRMGKIKVLMICTHANEITIELHVNMNGVMDQFLNYQVPQCDLSFTFEATKDSSMGVVLNSETSTCGVYTREPSGSASSEWSTAQNQPGQCTDCFQGILDHFYQQ